MWVLLSCLIYLYFFQTIPTSKQTGSTVTHLEKVSLFAPVSLLFLKSMTYIPLPLDTNFSCQLPTTFMEPHSIDTFWDSSSSPLQWYLIQGGCSLLPEALLSPGFLETHTHLVFSYLPGHSFPYPFAGCTSTYLPVPTSAFFLGSCSHFSFLPSLESLIYLGGFKYHLHTEDSKVCISSF